MIEAKLISLDDEREWWRDVDMINVELAVLRANAYLDMIEDLNQVVRNPTVAKLETREPMISIPLDIAEAWKEKPDSPTRRHDLLAAMYRAFKDIDDKQTER